MNALQAQLLATLPTTNFNHILLPALFIRRNLLWLQASGFVFQSVHDEEKMRNYEVDKITMVAPQGWLLRPAEDRELFLGNLRSTPRFTEICSAWPTPSQRLILVDPQKRPRATFSCYPNGCFDPNYCMLQKLEAMLAPITTDGTDFAWRQGREINEWPYVAFATVDLETGQWTQQVKLARSWLGGKHTPGVFVVDNWEEESNALQPFYSDFLRLPDARWSMWTSS